MLDDRTDGEKEELGLDSHRPAAPVAKAGRDRSADPMEHYFRDVGTVELLPREAVVALAERMEVGRLQIRRTLFSVPLAIATTEDWAAALERGELRVRDLVEVGVDEEAADKLVEREAKLLAGVVAQLRTIGSDGDVALVPERIAELVSIFESEQDALKRAERELAAKTGKAAATARKAIREIEKHLGLKAAAFHRVMATIAHARREIGLAEETLLRAHLRLVVQIARKYRGMSALDLSDLVQEGNLGLMRAIEKYDHRRGVKLSTYAVWWIRQSITRAMADQGRMIRIPVHMTETIRKVARERRRLQIELGHDPEREKLAARAGVAPHLVDRVDQVAREPMSLDLPVGEDGDMTLGDLIEAEGEVDPHSAAEASDLRNVVAEAIEGLTPREQAVIRMRFGLSGASEQTLEEVGRAFGVTRERIRQIEAKALAKLRHPTRVRKLSTFIER